MQSIRLIVLCSIACILSPSSVRAQEGNSSAAGGRLDQESADEKLSLAAIEQIALQRNPTLIQAGAQVRISQGKALQAGLCPNPIVGYVGDQALVLLGSKHRL